ncbi:MAG: CotH kinase family protein [Anaerolineae bacterium]|nr:CotH kinase family protein [Anaerolineae bacterium]
MRITTARRDAMTEREAPRPKLGRPPGSRPFLLGLALGLLLAGVLGAAYELRAWRFVEEPARDLVGFLRRTVREDLQKLGWMPQGSAPNNLPILRLDIPFEAYQALAVRRAEGLEQGLLMHDEDEWYRAEIRHGQDAIPVRLRLKGDWPDHLGERKWSFRVKTVGDAALFGMRSFSLQSPATRRYLNEWLFLSELRRADVVAPRYSFLNLIVNGDPWGIYALEESFATELLASMDRRPGLIACFDEELMWQHVERTQVWQVEGDWAPTSGFVTFEYAEADEFDTAEAQSDPALREQSAAALGLLRGFQSGALTPAQAFDARLMGRYLAHSMLWGAGHGLQWHNQRYYYNPITAHLEPVGYDAMALDPEGFPSELAQYEDLAIMAAYAHEMQRICRREYLQELRQIHGQEFDRLQDILAQEFDAKELEPPWEPLAQRANLLAGVFVDGVRTVYAYQLYAFEPVGAASQANASGLSLQVGNVLRYPVALYALRCGDREIPLAREWLSEDDRDLTHKEAAPLVVLRKAQMKAPRYVTFEVPPEATRELLADQDGAQDDTLQLVTAVIGVEEPVLIAVRRNYPAARSAPLLPGYPSVEEALGQHPFLELAAPHADQGAPCLALREGTWHVEGDLILPEGYGLSADRPATLHFGRGAVLLSSGPLRLEGPAPDTIRLLPQSQADGSAMLWGGVIVLRAAESSPSLLRNVQIEGAAGVNREGWTTVGGLTFYESPVTLERLRIAGGEAPAALHIARSTFAIEGCEISDQAASAIVLDFAQGNLSACIFRDIGRDALDLTGSEVTLRDSEMRRIHDRAIVAGQGSLVGATGLSLAQVGLGVASKDMSRVTIEDSTIESAAIAGLAAYLEDEAYGMAEIEARGLQFHDTGAPAMAQIGSRVVLEGDPVLPLELDVQAMNARLASRGEMAPVDYRLGPSIHLIGYHLVPESPRAGGRLYLTLRWRTDAPLSRSYTVFTHLLAATGERVAQRDSMPRDNRFPTTRWPVGEPIDELRVIELPTKLPAGEYRLYLGMYLLQSGERLPVYGADGQEIPGGGLLLDTYVPVRR